MKRIEPESIGDVMRRTLSEEGMTVRLLEAKAVQLWPAVVGEELAAMMSKPVLSRGLMTCYVRNAPLRQELNMHRSRLCELLNEAVGKDVVKEIRFR